jgi:hypothetical protein
MDLEAPSPTIAIGGLTYLILILIFIRYRNTGQTPYTRSYDCGTASVPLTIGSGTESTTGSPYKNDMIGFHPRMRICPTAHHSTITINHEHQFPITIPKKVSS